MNFIKKWKYWIIALIITLLSVKLNGFIHINSQQISGMNTYSGGLPITWFEFYYPEGTDLTFSYIINNWWGHHFIQLGAMFLNVALIVFIIHIIKELFIKFISKNSSNS